MTFEQALEKFREKGQEILQWLNEHPEISGQEKKTCEYLTEFLRECGYRVISPRARMKNSFCAINPKKEENISDIRGVFWNYTIRFAKTQLLLLEFIF